MLNSLTNIVIVEENGNVIRNTSLREYVELTANNPMEFVILDVDAEEKIEKALESLRSVKRIAEIENLVKSLSFIYNPDGCSNEDIHEAAEAMYLEYLNLLTLESIKRDVTKKLEKLAYKVANSYVKNRQTFGCEGDLWSLANQVGNGSTNNSWIFMPIIGRDGITTKFFSRGVAKAYISEFKGKKALGNYSLVDEPVDETVNRILIGAVEIIDGSLNESIVPLDLRKRYMEFNYGEAILEKWKEIKEEYEEEDKEECEEDEEEYEEEDEEDEQYDDL